MQYIKCISTVLCAVFLVALLACGGAGGGASAPTNTTPNTQPPTEQTPIGITIRPAQATVTVSKTQHFTASVTNTTDTLVTWQVNGVNGGDSTNGQISNAGLYTAPAPATVPTNAKVTITAVAHADAAKTATATVTIVAPNISGHWTTTPGIFGGFVTAPDGVGFAINGQVIAAFKQFPTESSIGFPLSGAVAFKNLAPCLRGSSKKGPFRILTDQGSIKGSAVRFIVDLDNGFVGYAGWLLFTGTLSPDGNRIDGGWEAAPGTPTVPTICGFRFTIPGHFQLFGG